MAHTYCSSLFHCVFSTKERRKFITESTREPLWANLGGIAREHEMKALAVGGTEDHVHILLSLPATKTIAQAMREMKQGSSRWMHETCAVPEFAWQEGKQRTKRSAGFLAGCSAGLQARASPLPPRFSCFWAPHRGMHDCRLCVWLTDSRRPYGTARRGRLQFPRISSSHTTDVDLSPPQEANALLGDPGVCGDPGLGYFRFVPTGRESCTGRMGHGAPCPEIFGGLSYLRVLPTGGDRAIA